MLSPQHRAIVKSTVPLLESGGEALATHFYQKLLAEYPEVRPLFNQAHQESGRQPRALANGVLMYARHIDELEQLGDLVAKIINKHVALSIQPEHYPIVGRCLLVSIRDVLGSQIATDEVIEAWAAAYGQLADILIGLEKTLYDAKADAPGGWRGTRAFRVARKVVESGEITSFHLIPVDGGEVLAFEPGQYIGLRLVLEGQEVRRNYSLSALSNGSEYRISVKRESGGKVSNHLHDHIGVGDVLDLFPPAGDFTLRKTAEHNARPLVLLSGGTGITPMITMLHDALATGRPVYFIHSARHVGAHAFRDTIEALASQHSQLRIFSCYELADGALSAGTHRGQVDQSLLESWLPATRDIDVYFVGPVPFMRAMRKYVKAMGVADAQIHYEFFGPAVAMD